MKAMAAIYAEASIVKCADGKTKDLADDLVFGWMRRIWFGLEIWSGRSTM